MLFSRFAKAQYKPMEANESGGSWATGALVRAGIGRIRGSSEDEAGKNKRQTGIRRRFRVLLAISQLIVAHDLSLAMEREEQLEALRPGSEKSVSVR